MRTKLVRFLMILVLATGLVACGTAPETVNTDSIASTVVAQLQEELDDLQAAVSENATEAASEPTVAPTEQPTEEPTVESVPVNEPATVDSAEASVVDLQTALVDVYERANPSVVYIIVPPIGSGTGFVYSDEGYIVTNNHVVENGEAYEIVFASGERRSAEFVGADVDSDLAVLKVDQLPEGVAPLPLGDGESLEVGQFVVAIGNPFGEEGSMSMGIISGLGRSLPSQRVVGVGSSYSLPQGIQTDAPINPGNSGGPLLTLQGEVVGVKSRNASTTGANTGVGFAIPVEAVKQIVPSLIEDGSYQYPYMGVSFANELSLSDQETFGLSQTQGAYVLNVTQGSPAAQAGLRAADQTTGRGGDLVIAIDGQPVGEFSDLNAYLVFHSSPGQTVDLTVLRDGEQVVLPLTLAERP